MSDLKVEVLLADSWVKHPNADRLAILTIKGWNVVTQLAGIEERMDKPFIYMPVDSVLPEKLEALLFPPDSKITLTKSRIRSIRIRQYMSQGMVVPIDKEMLAFCPKLANVNVGDDITELLGIKKYEPPEPEWSPKTGSRYQQQPKNNPHFHKYTDIQHLKNYPTIFKDGDMVNITEKVHGSSARFGLLPTSVPSVSIKPLLKSRNWFELKQAGKELVERVSEVAVKSVMKLFKRLPAFEFVYGSRNLQLQNSFFKKSFYGTDIWGRIAKDLDIESKLKAGECLFGEIYGSGIQKNYTYGCQQGEIKFVAYDVQKDGQWLSAPEFRAWCEERQIEPVPFLYEGLFSQAIIDKLRTGDSLIGGQKVREGIVIKSVPEKHTHAGRSTFKAINDDYWLDSSNTDFH